MNILRDVFANLGERSLIIPPVFYDHGWTISIGKHFFANTGLTVLDIAPVVIGDNVWYDGTVEMIIRNEKYQGDLLLQKYYRDDHISKKDYRNHGEKTQYLIEDNHEPIISRGDFEQAQQLIVQRAERYKNGYAARESYPFTGKLICGHCGKTFRRRHNSGKIAWMCSTYMTRGKKHCDAKQVHESVLENISADVLGMEHFETGAFFREIDHVCIKNILMG